MSRASAGLSQRPVRESVIVTRQLLNHAFGLAAVAVAEVAMNQPPWSDDRISLNTYGLACVMTK